MSLEIGWLQREFHQLSADELYQLMRFRQHQLSGLGLLQEVDADGRDPLAWHLMGFAHERGLVACARFCLPGEEGALIRVDRLLCEPLPGLEEQLFLQVMERVERIFKLPLECEVTDAQIPLLKKRGFDIVVDRPAARSGMVCLHRG
ncbi:hypothetical protein [Aestuariirhabdus litorea]|uniref:GNAT family N-acetyltransferase n=1 Tax=Aestuariirhabdus litorea TaxID=2528527 RepID=A0A3P3VMG2_9GAMM|nr:hypothetical protein [Aestuariirhabdus litorea]RRJ83875.1 hypothetical protein D0544_01790 [Aestuariirhabdus litorea]RWW97098.1 hypothetical protein DZC74_01790 [Endozoicomonadaceae bacterium GTF-13]